MFGHFRNYSCHNHDRGAAHEKATPCVRDERSRAGPPQDQSNRSVVSALQCLKSSVFDILPLTEFAGPSPVRQLSRRMSRSSRFRVNRHLPEAGLEAVVRTSNETESAVRHLKCGQSLFARNARRPIRGSHGVGPPPSILTLACPSDAVVVWSSGADDPVICPGEIWERVLVGHETTGNLARVPNVARPRPSEGCLPHPRAVRDPLP